jgi:hypothetical protein
MLNRAAKKKLTLVPMKPTKSEWQQSKKDPDMLDFCLMNKYQGSPHMQALLHSAREVCKEDQEEPSMYLEVLKSLHAEYKEFRRTGGAAMPRLWANQRKVELLFRKDVKIDQA